MKFTPIQAMGRPYSFPIKTGEVLERGMGVFLDATGGITTTAAGASSLCIGLVDDVQTNPERFLSVDEVVSFTATPAGGTFTMPALTLAHPNVDLTTFGLTNASELYTALNAGIAKLQYWANDTWNDMIAGDTVSIKISTPANGIVTLVYTNGGAGSLSNSVAYTLRLVITYAYTNTTQSSAALGYVTTLDQFGNDSTLASKLATVYFGQGIYGTDAYDPYVVYAPAAPLYVKDGGMLSTTADTATTAIGYVVEAPSANYSAEEQVTLNQKGDPSLLKLMLTI